MSIKEKRIRLRSESGLTLIEAVIFISILSTIILAIVYSTTISLRRTQFNIRKINATRYSEEVEEWMRGEKESNWAEFLARSDQTYCMNEDMYLCSGKEDGAGGCWDVNTACDGPDDYTLGENDELNNGYRRNATLTTDGTRVNVVITTEWTDGPNVYDVTITSAFSRWE